MDDIRHAAALTIGNVVVPHESAHKHVAGTAEYIDDIIEPLNTLHAYIGLAAHANAAIVSLELDAVRKAPGVVGVLTAEDIPGINDISPAGGPACHSR